ncbi:MAG: hypothetical protein KZQ58_11260 [gamma proteobacterium symbiont of Bathyaustriella thionipta]|nr:hypothetical protein [gamma proteobacterium symbiont of Bathyaustriella thionipta]
MDFLDFEADQLYFDEPIESAIEALIEEAADLYGEDEAEILLLRANFYEPEHPMVLVALYRYFYYQHRYADALKVAERVLVIFARRLGLPQDWSALDRSCFENGALVSMTMLRFYMLALKGAGYLELRLGEYESALQRLHKVAEYDDADRMGARALIDVALDALNQTQEPEQTAQA